MSRNDVRRHWVIEWHMITEGLIRISTQGALPMTSEAEIRNALSELTSGNHAVWLRDEESGGESILIFTDKIVGITIVPDDRVKGEPVGPTNTPSEVRKYGAIRRAVERAVSTSTLAA